MTDEKLLHAAVNAASTIKAIYEWVDQVDAAGGATSIPGVAKCNAFLASLKKQKPRIDDLVMNPLIGEIEKRKNP